MSKKMDYEERDAIVSAIMDLVDQRIATWDFEWTVTDNSMKLLPTSEFWSDQLLNDMDDVLEEYTTGTWRNYN